MKKKIAVLIAVTVLLVFGIAQVASAAGMGWGGGPRMLNSDNMVGPVDALNLTDQQIAEMQQLNQDTYNQTRDLRIKLMDNRQELRQLQLQQNPDKAKIDAKIKELNDLGDKMLSITEQNREQCQSLLTQEQLDQMANFRGKMGRGFRGGFGAGSTQ